MSGLAPALLLGLLFLTSWAEASSLTMTRGKVEVQPAGKTEFVPHGKLPQKLNDGDRIRTGASSQCDIVFDDGSKVHLGARADFSLGRVTAAESSMEQKLGTMKAWVTSGKNREFKVRTPSAVAAVRGTEFQIDVQPDGRTAIDLYQGLLAVTDNAGNELLLQEGQHLEADPTQMGAPSDLLENRESKLESDRESFRNEVQLDATKEEVLAAAEKELKLAEYQQGKSLIDVSGARVRLESYILRPQPDQFKLVVLNERDARFDYFYYKGTFNTTLPTDLSVALRNLPGCVDAACPYFLTAFESGRSNLTDKLQEMGIDGHMVDVNNNASATDDVTELFDAAQDAYVDVTGRPVFQTLFDKYALYANGQIKEGWTGTNLTSYDNRNRTPSTDPITGASLGSSLIPPTVESEFGDPDQMHQEIVSTYNDDTFIRYDNFIISDEGEIARGNDFAGITSGTQFRSTLLNWNYQQVITASEFQGRSIDLVVAPKILIEAGLIQ